MNIIAFPELEEVRLKEMSVLSWPPKTGLTPSSQDPEALTFHANNLLLQFLKETIQCHIIGHLEGMGLIRVRGNQSQFLVSLGAIKCASHLCRSPGSLVCTVGA